MRKYKPAFAKEVDLDDPKTYDYIKEDTIEGLEQKMFAEIGMSVCYMHIYMPDIFVVKNRSGQKDRVWVLMKKFWNGRLKAHRENNIMWFKEQIFLFQDETENQC